MVTNQRASNTVSGLTLFAGSEVETQRQGHATVFFTGIPAKLYVGENSRVVLSGDAASPVVGLLRGSARFSIEEGASLKIEAAGALVQSDQGFQRGDGEVRTVNRETIAVSAITAPLRVSIGQESVIVPRGSLYTIRVDASAIAEQAQGPQGQGAPRALRTRALLVLMGVSIAVLTAVGIYLNNRNGVDDTSGFISPFVP
jgi:hypothetical protein